MLRRENARTVAVVAAVMVAFVAFAVWATPFLSVFEFDPDEGINMAKAVLVLHGFPLYSSIWSDQPPLVTWLLAGVLRVAGPSVVAARLTILFFGAVLMGCFFLLVRRTKPSSVALLATSLLAVSGYTAFLSVSIRIGLVSVALMTASLCIFEYTCNERNEQKGTLIAGFLAGLSLLAKLFTAPLFVLLAMNAFHRKTGRHLLTGFIAGVCPLFFIGYAGWAQLFFPHLIAYKSEMLGHHPLMTYFLRDFFLYLLALAGIVSLMRRPSGWKSMSGQWFFYGLLVVLFHHPLFIHHLFLLIIPASWLAAEVLEIAYRWNKYVTVASVLILVVFKAFGTYDEGHIYLPGTQEGIIQADLIKNLAEKNAGSPWIFTDRPMYAIRAGLLVPPEIAVLSNKRLLASQKKRQWMTDVLNKYDIRQILLARYTAYPASFAERIKQDFAQLPYESNSFLHFIRRDPTATAPKSNTK
jgi:4-amino-4-deoxy-L-arabinose transferase-like glycosyltransferase